MTDNNKTPNCNMREPLVAFLYDEASPEEARLVESHLKQCAACSQELQQFRKLRGMLQQWELDEMPVVRVSPPPRKSSFAGALKDLLTLTPVWAKACGGLAAAMLLLAVMGTDISVGQGGFKLKMSFLGMGKSPDVLPVAQTGQPQVISTGLTKEQVETMINQAVLQSEKQQKQVLEAQLTGLESQLRQAHSAEFARLSASVQQQRDQIQGLEQDIDRREGLDFTDILFSSTRDTGRGVSSGTEGGR
ncbi:MAG: anti-sigma factor family protein [Blastocatellia bacterium]